MEDYKEELLSGLTLAWKLARDNIQKAQGTQKQNYDRKCTKDVNLKAGDRVMVFMPAESQGKNWKLSRPFHGPYRVLQVTPTNAEVRLIDRPKDEPIFVALDRIRLCYTEQGDDSWSGHKKHRKRQPKKPSLICDQDVDVNSSSKSYSGPITRSRNKL